MYIDIDIYNVELACKWKYISNRSNQKISLAYTIYASADGKIVFTYTYTRIQSN